MTNTPSPNDISSSEDDKEQFELFFKLATEAKQFLIDHDIETITDTTPGHMAIWCKKHIQQEVEKAVREARIDELKRIPDSTVSLVQGYYFNERIKQLKEGKE